MRSKIEWVRRSQRVIRMISELHRMGYQRLRFMPSVRGLGWRLLIAPASSFYPLNGCVFSGWNEGKPALFVGRDAYFGWHDASMNSARELAEKFIKRFPELADAGAGRDWCYAGWVAELLGAIESDSFLPVAYSQEDDLYGEWPDPLKASALPIWRMHEDGGKGHSEFPLPPTGMEKTVSI